VFKHNSDVKVQLKRLHLANLSGFLRLALAASAPKEFVAKVDASWSAEEKSLAADYTVIASDSKPPTIQAPKAVYMNRSAEMLHPDYRNCMPNANTLEYAFRAMAILRYQLVNHPKTNMKKDYYLSTIHHSANNQLNRLVAASSDIFTHHNRLPSVAVMKKRKTQQDAPEARSATSGASAQSSASSASSSTAPTGTSSASSSGKSDAPTGTSETAAHQPSTAGLAKGGAAKAKAANALRKQFQPAAPLLIDLTAGPSFTEEELDKYSEKSRTDYFAPALEPFVFKALSGKALPPVREYIVPEAFTHLAIYENEDFTCLLRRGLPAPTHICCIIGLPGVYSSLFHSFALQAKALQHVKTMALLMPTQCFNSTAR
jgi:hypothetical protein